MSTYYEKLRSPQWQRKRLEIMQRDNFTCWTCGDTRGTLNVHHKTYRKNTEPWDYEDSNFVTLCEPCHKKSHERIEMAKNAITQQSYCLVLDAMNQSGKKSNQLANYAELLSDGAKSNHLLSIYMHFQNIMKLEFLKDFDSDEKISLMRDAIDFIDDDCKNAIDPFAELDAMIDAENDKTEQAEQ